MVNISRSQTCKSHYILTIQFFHQNIRYYLLCQRTLDLQTRYTLIEFKSATITQDCLFSYIYICISWYINFKAFNKSGYAIFLSRVQCDGVESNCKDKKGYNSYEQLQLNIETNLMKIKLNHFTVSLILSYYSCFAYLYFDFSVISISFPSKLYFFIFLCSLHPLCLSTSQITSIMPTAF